MVLSFFGILKIWDNASGRTGGMLFMHIALKYLNSHRYEIHALLAGILAFLLMLRLKLPVKRALDAYGEMRKKSSTPWKEHGKIYRRRLGILVILLDLLLSGGIFTLLSYISPLIHFSWQTFYLSGILSLTVYAVYDQLGFHKRRSRP